MLVQLSGDPTNRALTRNSAIFLLLLGAFDESRTPHKSMARTRIQILESRRQLRTEYGELFDSIAALLYRHDPIGINFEVNSDEYQTETETILPRLRGCHSPADVLQVIHAEFVRWFDPAIAGPPEHYKKLALEVWQLWQGHLDDRPKS